MKTENKDIDELIRDITRVGFMPKSEARRRILQILSTARLDERKKVVGEIRERLPEKKPYMGVSNFEDKIYNQYHDEVSDILEKVINEGKY